MLKVCLVIDVEGLISFRQKNPEWSFLHNFKKKFAYMLRNFLYDKKGYDKLYKIVVKNKFPASFMLIGSLFKPKPKTKLIDFGYHTWSHKPLTYISNNHVKKEVKNIYNAVSFSAPMNLIDDPLQPKRVLKILKKEGYKIAIWGGPTIRDKKGKIVVVPPRRKISKPITINEIKCVYISNFFDGKSNMRYINAIVNEIRNNADKDAVYCLTTHDFSNKNLRNFDYITKKLLEMGNKKMIKLLNLKQIVK